MRKNEEETSLANGELWEQFKKTVYFEQLNEFSMNRIKELRDSIIQASMDGKHEEARDLGQKLSGFLEINNWIDDTISTRAESLEYAREEKEFKSQLPHRL